MDIEKKIELVKRPPTEELIQEDDLKTLFETSANFLAAILRTILSIQD